MKNITLILFAILSLNAIKAQNVAISPTATTPAASAMLDVSASDKGVLMPRVSLTSVTDVVTIPSPATSLMVYNMATAGSSPNNVYPGYYYFDGSKWIAVTGSGGKDWSLLGNSGTIASTNFLGTTDAIDMVFRTNNSERMRIFSTGRIAINSLVTPIGMLDVRTTTASSLSDLGAIYAKNTNAAGTALNACGQGALDNGLSTGSGAAFIGVTTGFFAQYTSSGTGQCGVASDAFGAQWNIGYWSGAAYRKIIGNGTVSTIVDDLNGEKVVMNCPESPENLFMDYGSGKLVNGVAKITIDPIFSKNIIVDSNHPLKVFIQLEGDCKGVFVTNKTNSGFEVHELQGGVSNVDFSYSIVATHGDQTLVSSNGEVRVAKYDARWEKAPVIQKTVKQNSQK